MSFASYRSGLDRRSRRVVVIGAGITGVTTAYSLLDRGFEVTLVDRHRYPAMETSFANGGQLSASNAEVWTNPTTIIKGLRWIFDSSAPLALSPWPSWHKMSWLAEFIGNIRNYRSNTIETTRMAIAAREHLFDMAAREGIEFDLQKRGILHIYKDKKSFEQARLGDGLLREGGLDRRAVSAQEMHAIEPTLPDGLYAGFFTESDSTGDIHKFTRALADACRARGAELLFDREILKLDADHDMASIEIEHDGARERRAFDCAVVCAGVGSRQLASMAGDRINIYPVKGYSITVQLSDQASQEAAPWTSLLDDSAKIVTSRLGDNRFRVAGTAEFAGYNRDIRESRIAPLQAWTEKMFPQINSSQVVPWAGLRPMTPSMMPFVGRGRLESVFYNTGHGHLGWTLSAITAQMVVDSIVHHTRSHHCAPSRSSPRTVPG